MSSASCPLCKGTRLSQQALSSKIDGYNIAQLAAMEATELVKVLAGFKDPIAASMVKSLLQALNDAGLAT